MANILILGAGSMGTAFSIPCSDKNHTITIVGTHLENDFIDRINLSKKHPVLDCDIPKNVSFEKYSKFTDIIMNKEIDLITVAVSSKGIEWASLALSRVLQKSIPILILTKGLSLNNNNYEVLAHKMQRLLNENGVKEISITGAGGPCLAKGLANRAHTSVIFANTDIKVATKIANLVTTEYYHISTSTDVVGVETCAAIKNIFSMAIGASEGLCIQNALKSVSKNNFLNTAAALLQQSIYEMIIFTEKVKGKKETVIGPAGIGDLYVSADGGRNSKMGYYLGQGMSFIDAKKNEMKNDTVEGADLIMEIGSKVKNDYNSKELPLMISMIDAINDSKPLTVEWKNFKLKN